MEKFDTSNCTPTKISQEDKFTKGEFKSLSPFQDNKGVIRVGDWVITKHGHQHGHNGVAATIAKKRKKLWILKANKPSKAVKFKCGSCREIEHKTVTQLMANLPALCLAPFTHHSTSPHAWDYFEEEVQKFCGEKGMHWKFITPGAPTSKCLQKH